MSIPARHVFEVVVTDIRLESQAGASAIWIMSLDRTPFTPGDTGTLHAVTRTGTRLEIPVLAVTQDHEGILWHVVEKPLAAGTEVIAFLSSIREDRFSPP